MEFALVMIAGLVAGTLGGLPQLALVGAAIGFLTGIVASTGPVNAPFFLAYGLVKGADLGTEAMGSLVVFVAKAITLRSLRALPAGLLRCRTDHRSHRQGG